MATHHPVHASLGGGVGDHFLIFGDELHGVLHALLEMRGKRPVRQAKHAPNRIHQPVRLEQQHINAVAEEGEPASIEHDAVELIAMQHKQAAPVRGGVDVFADKLDAAEVEPGIVAERLVMVARHVDHARAALRPLEDGAHHVIVARRPVPALAQLPAVNDVADQIERLALGRLQEIEQQIGVAAGGAEMRVRDPDGAERHALLVRVQVALVVFVDPVGQLAHSFGAWWNPIVTRGRRRTTSLNGRGQVRKGRHAVASG